MATDFKRIIPNLVDHGVELILVGGVAAIAHGSARATYDVDVVYARGKDNLERLVAALQPLSPYLRGAPPGLPFRWDQRTVQAGLNFTLTTSLGDLDLLGEVAGGGTYAELLPHTLEMEMFGVERREGAELPLEEVQAGGAEAMLSCFPASSLFSEKQEGWTREGGKAGTRRETPACGARDGNG